MIIWLEILFLIFLGSIFFYWSFFGLGVIAPIAPIGARTKFHDFAKKNNYAVFTNEKLDEKYQKLINRFPEVIGVMECLFWKKDNVSGILVLAGYDASAVADVAVDMMMQQGYLGDTRGFICIVDQPLKNTLSANQLSNYYHSWHKEINLLMPSKGSSGFDIKDQYLLTYYLPTNHYEKSLGILLDETISLFKKIS